IFLRQLGMSGSLPSRILASNCASLRFLCHEELVKLGICCISLRAGLPVPSAPWHFTQYWRKSAPAAETPAPAGAAGPGGGPAGDFDESPCASTASGPGVACPTRIEIVVKAKNRVKVSL